MTNDSKNAMLNHFNNLKITFFEPAVSLKGSVSFWSGVFVSICASACNVFNPIVLSQVLVQIKGDDSALDKLVYRLNVSDINYLFSLYASLWFFANSLKILVPLILAKSNADSGYYFAERGARGLFDLPMQSVEQYSPGELGRLFIENPYDSIKDITNESFKMAFTTVELIAIGSLYYSIYGSVSIVGILGVFVSIIAATAAYSKLSDQCCSVKSDDNLKAMAQADDQVKQMVKNHATVHATNTLDHQMERFETKVKKYGDVTVTEMQNTSWRQVVHYAIGGVALFLVMTTSGGAVLDKDSDFDAEDFVLIVTYLLQVLTPMIAITQSIDLYIKSSNKMTNYQTLMGDVKQERVNSKVDDLQQQAEWKNNKQNLLTPLKIEFSHVDFDRKTSEGWVKVLDDVTFTIEAGKQIGIVGESGSGKSTLVKLIQGVYRPTNGPEVMRPKDEKEYDVWHANFVKTARKGRDKVALIFCPQKNIWQAILLKEENAFLKDIDHQSKLAAELNAIRDDEQWKKYDKRKFKALVDEEKLFNQHGEINYGGWIKLNDVNIEGYAGADLCGSIGIVPQEVAIFDGGFLYNLLYGNGDYFSRGDVDRRKINRDRGHLKRISAFVQLSKLHSQENDNKLQVSGGERQRLGLARLLDNKMKGDDKREIQVGGPKIPTEVVVASPSSTDRLIDDKDNANMADVKEVARSRSLLIFDEATSALDMVRERIIIEKIKKMHELHHKPTVLIVGHRLTAIKYVDSIIYLKNGRVVEQGTYSDLTTPASDNYKGDFHLLDKIHYGKQLTEGEMKKLEDTDEEGQFQLRH